jgi:hypothetical protein
MSRAVDELWAVAGTSPDVDSAALARAVEMAAGDTDSLDYRTRLLIRDSLAALEARWGRERFANWLARSPWRSQIQDACDPKSFDGGPGDIGFPSLRRRVVDVIRPETIERFLREISQRVSQPTRIVIGGSIPLILGGHLTRGTEDVDVVNEVPAELRSQHQFLDELTEIFKLRLAHFQSHYLPSGWEKRVGSLGTFGKLEVSLVDPYDIFVGKLFSIRTRDRADLNAMVSQLNRETITRRVRETTAGLRSDSHLLEAAKKNWYVLFGDELPT